MCNNYGSPIKNSTELKKIVQTRSPESKHSTLQCNNCRNVCKITRWHSHDSETEPLPNSMKQRLHQVKFSQPCQTNVQGSRPVQGHVHNCVALLYYASFSASANFHPTTGVQMWNNKRKILHPTSFNYPVLQAMCIITDVQRESSKGIGTFVCAFPSHILARSFRATR
jgi:hypothetical protein